VAILARLLMFIKNIFMWSLRRTITGRFLFVVNIHLIRTNTSIKLVRPLHLIYIANQLHFALVFHTGYIKTHVI